MIIRQFGSDYYVCRTSLGSGKVRKGSDLFHRNWWLIKLSGSSGQKGYLDVGVVVFPPEFVGKRIRLKVEVIEDDCKV